MLAAASMSSVADPGAAILALGPAAWYRYNRGITSSGGAVSQWADQSGNGRHLVQTTEAQKPTVDTDGSLLFDGVNDAIGVDFTLAQPTTVFLLAKSVSDVAGERALCDGGPTSGNYRLQIRVDGGDANYRLIGNGGAAALYNITSRPTLGAFGVVTAVFNGASSSGRANLGTPVTGTVDEGVTSAGGFTLGNSANQAWAPSNSAIAEAIVFNKTLSSPDADAVVTYLMALKGLS